jgi:hypothetical protein
MKDMKSMKGWFAVDPDVSHIRKAHHFLTQRRRECREILVVKASLLSGIFFSP